MLHKLENNASKFLILLYKWICYRCISNKRYRHFPISVLKHLILDKSDNVRWYVVKSVFYYAANNPNTPQHVLELLAKDKYWTIRRWVATNPNTPTNVLELLANDEDWWVRYWVAKNPNTPLYIRYYFHYKNYLNLL